MADTAAPVVDLESSGSDDEEDEDVLVVKEEELASGAIESRIVQECRRPLAQDGGVLDLLREAEDRRGLPGSIQIPRPTLS